MPGLLHVFFNVLVLMPAVLAVSDHRLVRRESPRNPASPALAAVEADGTAENADEGGDRKSGKKKRRKRRKAKAAPTTTTTTTTTAFDPNATVPVTGPVGECSIKGDPHIKSFDKLMYHAITAKGHWWAVRMAHDFVSIQGIYDICGKKHSGKRATCLVGIAIGGEILRSSSGAPTSFAVKHPCGYQPASKVCNFGDGKEKPVVEFNGTEIDFENEFSVDYGPTINVTRDSGKRKLTIELPRGIEIVLLEKIREGKSTNFDGIIKMPKFGQDQCGHCGDFDGDKSDEGKQFYKKDGFQIKGKALCDAKVLCQDRLVKQFKYGSVEKIVSCNDDPEPDEDEDEDEIDLSDFSEQDQIDAKARCEAAFAAEGIDTATLEDEIAACVWDDLAGGEDFDNLDAETVKEEEEEK